MAVAMSSRRVALAAGVGVCGGCVGTWFEMSHGVLCIPVLTMPPLGLSHAVASGSTVVGVALRQTMSAGLMSLDPRMNWEKLHEVVDMNAAGCLALSGTMAAVSAATVVSRIPTKRLRKINGGFCIVLGLFIQWRETRVAKSDEEKEAADVLAKLDAEATDLPPTTSLSHLGRFLVLGAGSGAILGFFGIGAAWLLAPVITYTTRGGEHAPTLSVAGGPIRYSQGLSAGLSGTGMYGTSGADERSRRTAALGMVLPCIAAALRHVVVGNVPETMGIAVPLALGAVLGSALAGTFLENVPCEEEHRNLFTALLVAYGAWSIFKPGV
uniref:Membrane transporter protein n=1 Tax=Noctiluca scintillans TaxID=2966 RepID=A0A7S1F5Q0_NOCSC|mmetsp:Transcript_34263/g.91503  ORF Transcript_34263/g.91503 Transcript_34263/m.91503 type:complete len:325 (+) Transcript_34263:39-1013(+)